MISILRKNKSYLYTFLLVLGMCFSVSVMAATADKSIGFQGQLYAYNAPVTNTVNATFTFYDALTDGNVTGTQISKTITVSNGYFGTTFTESDTTGVDFNQQLFLEVTINGTPLTPRTSVNPTVSSLKTFGAFSYATPPTVGPVGSLYFNSTTNELYVSQGSTWQLAGVSSSTTQWTPNGTTLNYMAGNVGIGTTTPSELLHIAGGRVKIEHTSPELRLKSTNDTTAFLAFRNNAESSRGYIGYDFSTDVMSFRTATVNNRFVIDGSGNIGIGTGTPAVKLDVRGADEGSAIINLTGVRNSTSGNPQFQFTKFRGTSDAPTALIASDRIGLISFNGYNGSTAPSTNASISAWTAEAFSTTSLGTTLRFDTTATGTISRVERMRIDSNGNIGIGTTTPITKLDVWGSFQVSTSSTPVLFVDTATSKVSIGTSTTAGRTLTVAGTGIQVYRSGASPHIEFIQGGTAADLSKWRIAGETNGDFHISPMTDANGNIGQGLRFSHDNRLILSTAGTETTDARLIVDSGSVASTSAVFLSGNVGIGTTTPTAINLGKVLHIQNTGNTNTAADNTEIKIESVNRTAYLHLVSNANSAAAINFGIPGVPARGIINYDQVLNAMKFSTAAVERMRIDGSGNVGIGTTTPGALLDVYGTARVANLSIGTNATIGSTNQPIKINGVVGNGTNNYGFYDDSTKRFSSSGTESESFSSLYTVDTTASNFSITNVYGFRYRPTVKTGSGIVTNAYGGYFDVPTLATNNFSLLTTGTTVLASGGGNVGIGTTTPSSTLSIENAATSFAGTSISAYVNRGSTNAYSFLKFNNNSGEQFTVLGNGNLGLGSSTPSEKLVVNGNIVSAGNIRLDYSNPNSGLYGYSSSNSMIMSLVRDNTISNGSLGLNAFGGFGIATGNSSGVPTSTFALWVSSTGSVGIGTTSPGAKLDVNGDVRAGYFTATSTTATSTLSGALNIISNNAYPLTVRPSASAAGGLALFEYLSGNASIAISGNSNGSATINFGTPANRSLGAISYRNDALASRPNFMTFSTAGSERMVIDASGNVGIGTSSPVSKLSVSGAINSTDLLGGITTLSTDASGNIIRTPSDSKLKTNVETITSALEKVNQIRGVSYNWLDTSRFGPDKEIGFIAQELETIVPEVVKSGGEYKSVNYQNLVALLVEAIKELSTKFDGLSKKVKTEELCLEDVCINKTQLRALLNAAGQNANVNQVSPPTPAPVEPVQEVITELVPPVEPAPEPILETPTEPLTE